MMCFSILWVSFLFSFIYFAWLLLHYVSSDLHFFARQVLLVPDEEAKVLQMKKKMKMKKLKFMRFHEVT